MATPKPLDNDTLQAIVKMHISSAVGSRIGSDGGGDLAADREKALEYYRGEPFGNEVEGRSKVVSRDVMETVEWLMPSILDIFVSSDEAVRFDPVGPEDEEAAKQATEVCNHIFHKENDGFQILYDIIKDALLQKTGIAKAYWEDKEEQKTERYEGLTEQEYQKLLQDDELELEEVLEYEEMLTDPMSGAELPMTLYDARGVRTTTEGRVKIVSVPPEEFLFSRRAVKLEDERGHMEVPFVCHRVKKTISDLIQEGFTWDQVHDIPSAYEGEYNDERNVRFRDDDVVENTALDQSMREVWLHECYLRVDVDGDGIAETRKILVGGTGQKILSNEEVDEQPFVLITPMPMPHALVGDSIADHVMDIQELKSTIWRQLLDNIYSVNNARPVVNDRVDLDTLLNNALASAVVVEGDTPVGDAITYRETPSIANHVFPMLEYADQVREARTGTSRLNQGLDPDALNDTASGMNMLMTASQKRMMLIARVFAQTGIRDMFRKILRMVVKYQDKPKVMRLTGGYTEVDPSGWNIHMDVSVNVGLGYGSREQQIVSRRMILDTQIKGIELQGGINGPLIYANHVSKAFRKLIEATGEQQPDAYVEDISPEQAHQPPPPQPDPEMQKMQAEMQMEQQKLQMDQQAKQQEMEMKRQSEERAAQIDLQKVQAQLQLDREKHEQEMRQREQEFALQMQIERAKAANNAEIARYSAAQKAEAQRETASQGE